MLHLSYTKADVHDPYLAGSFVLDPDEELRFVSWLHEQGIDFIIETDDFHERALRGFLFSRSMCMLR